MSFKETTNYVIELKTSFWLHDSYKLIITLCCCDIRGVGVDWKVRWGRLFEGSWKGWDKIHKWTGMHGRSAMEENASLLKRQV